MRTFAAAMALGVVFTGCGTSAAAPPSGSPSRPSIPTMSINVSPVSAKASTGQVVLTLSEPYGNAHVKTSFIVRGTSNSVEANTPWSLTNATTHKVVRRGSFTADGWGDKLYPYRGTVSVAGLPAGKYMFSVRIDDPSDGEGKPVPQVARVVFVG